jgi:hypothetical protein
MRTYPGRLARREVERVDLGLVRLFRALLAILVRLRSGEPEPQGAAHTDAYLLLLGRHRRPLLRDHAQQLVVRSERVRGLELTADLVLEEQVRGGRPLRLALLSDLLLPAPAPVLGLGPVVTRLALALARGRRTRGGAARGDERRELDRRQVRAGEGARGELLQQLVVLVREPGAVLQVVLQRAQLRHELRARRMSAREQIKKHGGGGGAPGSASSRTGAGGRSSCAAEAGAGARARKRKGRERRYTARVNNGAGC